jgi:hypothetical protein
VVNADSISVENSGMISVGSSNSSGKMTVMSSVNSRISFQAILSNSEMIEHKEQRGYFISEELIGHLERLQSNISNISIGPPPRDESIYVDLDFSSFLEKSSRSIQRLEQEQREQI